MNELAQWVNFYYDAELIFYVNVLALMTYV